MKNIALPLALMTSSVFAATPQQFYRAAKNANLIELNSRMDTIVRKEYKTWDEDEIGITDFDFILSRGVSKDIAVGVSMGNKTQGHGGGFKDIRLFLEGQYQKYFYGFDLGLSADIELDEDGYPENAKSGGTNYKVTMGYTPVEYLGVKVEYMPGYTQVVQPKTSDYIETDVGDTLWVQSFVEFDFESSILGFAFGGSIISPDKNKHSLDERYNTAELYYVYNWSPSLEFTSGFNYWFGNVDNYFQHREGMDLGLRYKF